MPYDNEYNRMLARDIDYFNRKYITHSDATGQGTVDYRSSYASNPRVGGGAGSAEYKLNGGAILGLQDGTVMGGPKVKPPNRAVLSTFSSLGAPLQPASGFTINKSNVSQAVRQALEEQNLYGRGREEQSSQAELKKILDAEMKKEQSKFQKKTENYAEKDANKEVDKAISERTSGGAHLGNVYLGGAEGVRTKAEAKQVLLKALKEEEDKINEKTHDYNVKEAEKEVARELKSNKDGGFLRKIAAKAAPALKKVAVSVAKDVAKNVTESAKKKALDYFVPQQPSQNNEPHQSHLAYDSTESETESITESPSDTESDYTTETESEEQTESEEKEEKEEKGKKGKKASKGKKEEKEDKAYKQASKPRASNVGAKSQFQRPTVTRTNYLEKTEKPPAKKEGKGMGGSFIASVPASIGVQQGPKVKSEMRGSYMSGGAKPKRAEIVKKIMKEKGISMIEASKYVKQHNLY